MDLVVNDHDTLPFAVKDAPQRAPRCHQGTPSRYTKNYFPDLSNVSEKKEKVEGPKSLKAEKQIYLKN